MWKVLTNHRNHHPTHSSRPKNQNHLTIVIKTLSSGWWHTRNTFQPIITPNRPQSATPSRPTLPVIIHRPMPTQTRINTNRQSLSTAIIQRIAIINTHRWIKSPLKAASSSTRVQRACRLHFYRHSAISTVSIRFHTSTIVHLETIIFSMASSRWISTRTLMDRFRLRRRLQEPRQRPMLKHRS